MDLLKLSDFSRLDKAEVYYKQLKTLKQKLLLKSHLHYNQDEIRKYLESLNIEESLIDLIIEKYQKKGFIDERNKVKLIDLWYEQYLDFGVQKGSKHYPDLIIFDFQKQAIKRLYTKYSSLIESNEKTKKFIQEFLIKILNNEYTHFGQAMTEYYSFFNVKQVFRKSNIPPKERKIIGIPSVKQKVGYRFPKEHNFGRFIGVKRNRPIRKFISKLKRIIMGGIKKDRLYMPFFMANESIQKKAKKFLRIRLRKVINTYYPQFRKGNIENYANRLKAIGLKPEFILNNQTYSLLTLLNLPPINLKLFDINWDFMPKTLGAFYDGFCKEDGKTFKKYSIAVHPLPLFLSFLRRETFSIFLDQLLHHEFIHLLQYRLCYIHDAFLLDEEFREKHSGHYNFLRQIAKVHFIDEDIPEDFPSNRLTNYILTYGGHTPTFRKEVQNFRNCDKAMRIRGKIENLYSGFRYKLWGEEIPETIFWILCNE
jgi:hypothetical protein